MTARNNRFTDPTPFTPLSALSPEAREWHIKVAAAKARERRGEPGAVQELIELGVYPPDVEEVRARRAAEREARQAGGNIAGKEVSVELDKATIAEIKRMADQGKRIVEIADQLGLEWKLVRKNVDLNWLGAKNQITIRLKKLHAESDPDKRAELIKEIDRRVDYLYYRGRDLGKQINRARDVLKG